MGIQNKPTRIKKIGKVGNLVKKLFWEVLFWKIKKEIEPEAISQKRELIRKYEYGLLFW